eukprot:12604754-Ditylum_brightwellii.AAC.1
MVIHIERAEVDAMYLKVLFATAYETGNSAGIFIPADITSHMGKRAINSSYATKNAYLKDIG